MKSDSNGPDDRGESPARRRWERLTPDAPREACFDALKGVLAEYRIQPHGIDFIPELVELARRRHPEAPPDAFEVAHALYWTPKRRYDWVRTELVYGPPADRAAFAQRLYDLAVAPVEKKPFTRGR